MAKSVYDSAAKDILRLCNRQGFMVTTQQVHQIMINRKIPADNLVAVANRVCEIASIHVSTVMTALEKTYPSKGRVV